MRTKLVLYGALAQAVGKAEWEFDAATPAEALQALEVNTDKLLDHLYENLGSEYRFVIDGKEVAHLEQLGMIGASEIHVMPVLKGSGSNMGMWLLIIGVVIIALVAGPGGGYAAAMSASLKLSTTAAFFLTVGVAVALSGVSQLLTPSPKKFEELERPENRPSYLMNGAVNTYRQGNAIPIGFGGPIIIGSQVISAGVKSVDIYE